MIQKCATCNRTNNQSNMKILTCEKHFVCNTCIPRNQIPYCDQCDIVISQSQNQSQMPLRTYPIQGLMVNYDKLYNPEGESEFSSNRNCYQRTNGWILCNLLAVIFFFAGLAVAIKTTQKGTGAIMAVIGVIGVIASIYFICKIRKVDRYIESSGHLNQDNFIYIKHEMNQRRTISSARTEQN